MSSQAYANALTAFRHAAREARGLRITGLVTMDVTVPADQAAGNRAMLMGLFGTGPGNKRGSTVNCSDCITVF